MAKYTTSIVASANGYTYSVLRNGSIVYKCPHVWGTFEIASDEADAAVKRMQVGLPVR